MKKLLLVLVFAVLLVPLTSRAAESVFGFGDGKYYDVTGDLKYFCFIDGNCFSMDGNPVDMRAVLDAMPAPSFTQAVYKPYADTPTPLVSNPNQPMQLSMTQSIVTEKQHDPSLIDCSNARSNCRVNGEEDYASIFIKTVPAATVSLTFDGSVANPTQLEQGLATNGQKHYLFSFPDLEPGSEHTYSLRVETENAWDVEEGTVTLPLQKP